MKLVFTGDSWPGAAGWPQGKNQPELFTNLCHYNIPEFAKLDLVNAGVSGASNTDIFENTVEQITKHRDSIEYLYVMWTNGPRYNFNVGLEDWDTRETFFSHIRSHKIKLSNGDTYSRDYISNLVDRLRTLHHPHYEIVKIIRYSSLLKTLANNSGIKNIRFINELCPWDNCYFNKLDDASPEDYTEFTKNVILEIEHRLDDDILKQYNRIHQDYADAGWCKELEDSWVNLYHSLMSPDVLVDANSDGVHPGVQSNINIFNIIKNSISN